MGQEFKASNLYSLLSKAQQPSTSCELIAHGPIADHRRIDHIGYTRAVLWTLANTYISSYFLTHSSHSLLPSCFDEGKDHVEVN
jgi:hypothetical protein